MKGRDGVEFLVTVAGIDVNRLVRSGQPADVADLSHIAGLCYELCRFNQAARDYYERLVRVATQNPAILDEKLVLLRSLIGAVADGKDFELLLKKRGTRIRVEGSQFHRRKFQSLLPFVFWSREFKQGLVVTAVFYLGLTRDTMLVRRCPWCEKIFLGVRKTRIFCSHAHASRAAERAFKERQAAKKAGRQKESGR